MKKTLLIMLVLLASLVAAAAVLSDLTLQGDSGTSVQGTVVLSGIDKDIPVTLTSSNLVSGGNVLSNSYITISGISAANSTERQFLVTVNIPGNQPSGVYSGTLTALDNNVAIAQSTFTLTVESGITPGASYTLSDVEFGDDSQEREQTINSYIKIVNTGTEDLVLSLNSNVPSEYQFTLSQVTVNVASGQTLDVPVTLYVPDDQDSGRKNVGSITAIATNAGGLTHTANVYLETKSELTITRVKAVIDGKSSTLDDGEDVDAKPGDDVTLTVTLRNDFDTSIDIEDISVDVQADNDLDWDDSEDISRIRDGDKEDVDFSFTVPDDIDEDSYDVDITAEGRDENGARHEADYTITINVDRESHEISIESVTLNPSHVTCDGRVTLRTRVRNTGNHDEDNVQIAVENDELGIAEYVSRFSLDQDDSTERTVSFDVPTSAQPGEYLIDITTYYDSKESDYDVASLYVDQCTQGTTGGNTQPPTGTGGTTNTTIPPVIYPSGTVGPSYGGTSFFNTPAYIVLLVVAVLIFLVLIALLLVKFVF